MTAIAFVAVLAACGAVALGLAVPAARAKTALVLLVLAVAAWVAAAAAGLGERELEVTSSFVAFVGNELQPRSFAIETVRAPGWLWPAVASAFCACWAAALRWRRGPVHPFWAPMLLAWTAAAALLLLEKAAAPAGLVRPAAFDRALAPASLAACAMLALRCRTLPLTYSWLVLFVTCTRLPLALVGTLATRGGWGTSLDVHSVVRFANPFAQLPVEVDPASTAQLGWLVWAPQLVVYPALYMLSLGGIAFGFAMFERQRRADASRVD